MGYFSQTAIDRDCAGRGERSDPPPALQWEWRLADLLDRLEELGPGAEECRARYTEDDLQYALPKDLLTRDAVLGAIEAARERLGRNEPAPALVDSTVPGAESAKAA